MRVLIILLLSSQVSWADDQPTGQRVLWTKSRIYGSPDPPSPYTAKLAFPHLKFDEPVALTVVPGTSQMAMVERYGKILTFENDPKTTDTKLFLDVAEALCVLQLQTLGIAFHPRFQHNGLFFVCYRMSDSKLGTRVSRFRVRQGDSWQADPDSEMFIISWPHGHDGGCLKFGPDGYLYISNGDEGSLHDPNGVGQDLSNLQCSIMRIDVDGNDGDKAYRIPQDNPFVDTPGARPEIWAYGFRQPWRISFDRQTGDLWTCDVGEDLWESVHRVQRGGNYGWSVTEGGRPFRPQHKRGPTPILKPIVAHDHSVARSITGGYVYRGMQLAELHGKYIYGDYDTGKVWMLGYDGQQITAHVELCDLTIRLVAFSEDAAGELYLIDHIGGQVYRLAVNEVVDTSAEFPRQLSQTGLFDATDSLTPAPGLMAYDVIAPQWCDGATKQRYLALPGDSQVQFEAVTFPGRGGRHGWKFPDGAVLVETISLAMEEGNPDSKRRLETRILHQERLMGGEEVGDQYWRGYTYIWNDDQTDAQLLENPRGLDRTFSIKDPEAPSGVRQQTWHFHGRTECSICHNMAAKYVLGCQTLQMNRSRSDGGGNQLVELQQLGVFSEPLPKPPTELPRLVDVDDRARPVVDRARSYLHANCSHCHRNGGGGNAGFFTLASLSLDATKMLGANPNQGTFFIPQARVVSPGQPFRSMIYYRMASLGGGRMPRLGSRIVDQRALDLMHEWILELPEDSQTGESVTDVGHEQGEFLDTLTQIPQPFQQRSKYIDQVLGSTIGALQLVRAIDEKRLPEDSVSTVIARATQHQQKHIRDLFEKYLPEQERTKRLGSTVEPHQILQLEGNVERGSDLFFKAAGVQCRNCHRVRGQGSEVGPDLDQIGRKYDQAQILASILEPSKNIDAKYLQYHCETSDGRIVSGLLVEKNDNFITLRDAKAQVLMIPAGEVESLTAQSKSMMPDLLLRDLTAQQVADLTLFLDGLE